MKFILKPQNARNNTKLHYHNRFLTLFNIWNVFSKDFDIFSTEVKRTEQIIVTESSVGHELSHTQLALFAHSKSNEEGRVRQC